MSVRDTRRKSLCALLTLAALLAAALLSACNPNPQPAGLTPIPTLAAGATPTLLTALQAGASAQAAAGPAEAAVGAAVYLENCTTCHGLQAEGVSGPALRNNRLIKAGSDQAVASVISQGRAGTAMPAWLVTNGGALTAAQIADVVAYLRTFQAVPALPTATPLPPEPTEPPPAAGAEPARPSFEGGPGQAVNLAGNADRGRVGFGLYCAACHGPQGRAGRPNPDSDDGAVPGINPIDPTLLNADPKLVAENIDLFIEHGSVPAGTNPQLMMPAFGDAKLLTDQQIADLLAYVIALNKSQ
jgi:mono/diheme cytochrome c family protein